jgi:nifR3 family TIM-barrel protein
MRKAVALPVLKKFDIIDINMGCPVNKVVKNGEGSALMKDPLRASELVLAAVEGAFKRPVTVKIRSGFDKVNAPEFAALMERSGATAVTVHGRLREEFYSGRADWRVIAAVKQAVKIPVIGNGDVKSAEDCRRMIAETSVDGVMIARGALGKPWIFAEIAGNNFEHDVVADIKTHIGLLRTVYTDAVAINLMKAHLCRYSSARRGGRALRENLPLITTFDDIIEAARRLGCSGEL